MPRRAIESIENEVRSLARRIDDTRQNGIDANALAGIERALSEIREVLRSLTPAEQLAGYDEAIRNLGGKLDLILRSNDDPSTVQRLESAIAALRAVVSNVASNDALARLSDDVHALSSKVDQLSRTTDHSAPFAVLEQRVAALTSTLESRERPAVNENTDQIEGRAAGAVGTHRPPVGRRRQGFRLRHLEQRVSYLLERLEASADQRPSLDLGRVEDGLHDILRHLENQNATFSALAQSDRGTAEPADKGLIDLVKRELSDIRFSQTEAGRHTQDSLEAVHSTLGHVVDRLAMIEGDLRAVRSQPAATPPEAVPAPPVAPPPVVDARVEPQQPKPELPNPAAAQEHFATAPREFHAAPPPMPAAAMVAPLAISEILEPYTLARHPIEPGLPPDHPLEPGTRPTGRTASPSERIAASESAISEIPAAGPKSGEKVSTSSFIAAARRAAQAAAAAQPIDGKGTRGAMKKGPAGDKAKEGSTITSRIRSLLVGASVVVIVLGTFKVAMSLLDAASAPPAPAAETSEPPAAAQPPAENSAKPAAPDPATPSLTSPTPIGRQSLNNAAPGNSDVASVAIPPAAAPSPATPNDVTGAISAAQASLTGAGRRLGQVQVPPSETCRTASAVRRCARPH